MSRKHTYLYMQQVYCCPAQKRKPRIVGDRADVGAGADNVQLYTFGEGEVLQL